MRDITRKMGSFGAASLAWPMWRINFGLNCIKQYFKQICLGRLKENMVCFILLHISINILDNLDKLQAVDRFIYSSLQLLFENYLNKCEEYRIKNIIHIWRCSKGSFSKASNSSVGVRQPSNDTKSLGCSHVQGRSSRHCSLSIIILLQSQSVILSCRPQLLVLK